MVEKIYTNDITSLKQLILSPYMAGGTNIMIKTTKSPENATCVTHGGTFHSDEVMSTVILSKVLGDINVLRTFKVPENLPNDAIVYDIGFGMFDHHQKGGNGFREESLVPYSSAGLIWKQFGWQIVIDSCDGQDPVLVWNLIDRDLIEGIDASDNGTIPKSDYSVREMNFPRIISSFNPAWDNSEDSDAAFIRAVNFAEVVFDNVLSNAISKAKAHSIVEAAIEESQDNIMVLEKFVPWQEYLFSSENEKAEDILFVVYPSNRGGFNWQCVPDSLGSFEQRKPVPTEWKGLHDVDLQKVTGVATASFCHPAGFIGGAATLADAIAIAKKAIEA